LKVFDRNEMLDRDIKNEKKTWLNIRWVGGIAPSTSEAKTEKW
jgi:hypothetical protein